MNKLSQICNGQAEDYPISKDKLDNCYTPNGETYPLCKGKIGKSECNACNVYEE
ncbi:hypothetical protein ACFVS2_25620 [Brevibacillus sp. NPDC058079]|uniref:hypothetical protein n=1 Tax=Brevibacillus sp. NPDC058079 TaxID=3346330 RepID=UPI0036E825D6